MAVVASPRPSEPVDDTQGLLGLSGRTWLIGAGIAGLCLLVVAFSLVLIAQSAAAPASVSRSARPSPQSRTEGSALASFPTVQEAAATSLENPFSAVMEKIKAGDFLSPEEVATGRFLHNFYYKKHLIGNLGAWSPHGRNSRWTFTARAKLDAPEWEGVQDYVELRFEWIENRWKLEQAEMTQEVVRPARQ